MRLYAFLLFILFAHAARAATIPAQAASPNEEKLNVLQQEKDKIPEIPPSDQEQLDQTNVINDVDNKLRIKPAEIPVEVQNAEQALKASDESEEIIRPAVDLRNPGPPQRQEHETQNPAFYAAEQDLVQAFKKNLNDAQIFLRQGILRVSEGVQNMLNNNEQVKVIQDSIQKLQEGFVSQLNKLNGTVQTYLQDHNTNAVIPGGQQTKANFEKIGTDLKTIKEDFNNGVKTLANGVEVLSSLKAEKEKQEQPTPGATPSPTTRPPSDNLFINFITNFQNQITNNLNNFVTQTQNIFRPGQQTGTGATGQPAGTQADTPSQGGGPFAGLGTGQGPFVQSIQAVQSMFNQYVVEPIQNLPVFGSSRPQATQATSSDPQTEKPNDPVALDDQTSPVTHAAPVTQAAPITQAAPVVQAASVVQAAPVTQPGPIRQILQNNPISQGIAATVQRLQNINNPNKPRDTEKNSVTEILSSEDKKKGHSQGSVTALGTFTTGLITSITAAINGTAGTVSTAINNFINTIGTNIITGDNNDSSNSGLNEISPSNEVQKDALPKEEIKEQKTEEVVVKTE